MKYAIALILAFVSTSFAHGPIYPPGIPLSGTATNNNILYYQDGALVDSGFGYTNLVFTTNSVQKGTTNDMADGSITNLSILQFSGGTGTQGTLSWNDAEETIDIIQNGSVLQVGQEFQLHAKNATGSTITNGTVVMYAGTDGASGNIKIAPATTSDAKLILGVVTYDIANGDLGKVTTNGKVRGLDTSAWNAEDILYYAPGGALTNVAPTSGLVMPIAVVINSHDVVGTLMVRITPIDEGLVSTAQATADAAVEKNNGTATNLTVIGTLTSTNIAAAIAESNAVQDASNAAAYVEDDATYASIASAATNAPFGSDRISPMSIGTNGLHIAVYGQSQAIGYPQSADGLTASQYQGIDGCYLNQDGDSAYTGPLKVNSPTQWGFDIVAGNLLNDVLSTNIYFTKVGYSGNAMSALQSGTAKWTNFVNEVSTSESTWSIEPPSVLVFVHGEADSNLDAGSQIYETELNTLLNSFTNKWPGIKFVITGINKYAHDTWAYADRITAAQVSVCNARADAVYVDTYNFDSPAGNVHYDSKGLIDLGGAIAGAIDGWFGTAITTNGIYAERLAGRLVDFTEARGGKVRVSRIDSQYIDTKRLSVNGYPISSETELSTFGLDLYLPFEDDSTNYWNWANGSNLVLTGTATKAFDYDRLGGAVNFNGSATNYLTFTQVALSTNFTVAAWLKFNDTTDAYSYIVGSTLTMAYPQASIRIGPTASKDPVIFVGSGAGQYYYWVDSTFNGPDDYTKWHHYAFTVSNSTNATFYVDGVVAGSDTSPVSVGSPTFSSTYFKYIGVNNLTGPGLNGFNGSIDEVVFESDIALSADQVYDLYASQLRNKPGIKGIAKP